METKIKELLPKFYDKDVDDVRELLVEHFGKDSVKFVDEKFYANAYDWVNDVSTEYMKRVYQIGNQYVELYYYRDDGIIDEVEIKNI